MQKLTITGITSDDPKSIVWGGLPNDSYLVIRNRTQDDGVVITQTIALDADEYGVVNYKEVSTPIKRGEEHSFLVADPTLPFEVSTTTKYDKTSDINCITAIVLNNSNSQTDNLNIYVVNLINEKALINNTTQENKGVVYLQAAEFNVKLETILQDDFPTKRIATDTRLIQKTNYTANIGAGRGYLLKTITGLVQGTGSNKDTENILKQVENYNHNQSSAGDSTDLNIATIEVPYIPKFIKNDILTFGAEIDKEQSYIEYPKAMGNAFFFVQVSKGDSISVLNNKTYSNIKKIGTAYTPDDSTKQNYNEMKDDEGFNAGYNGDADDILDTRMWCVGADTQYQWNQDRFNPQSLKFIAFTLQSYSQDYPYSIAFTAPLFGGITFLSDTKIKLHLGNREVLYSLKESHLYKVYRILMNYEADYLQLYINGEKIEHESQSATTFTNKEINTFGADIKTSYSHSEESINILSQVLGAKSSLDITAENDTINEDNDLIEPNDYKITYTRKDNASARVFVLPKQDSITNKNQGVVPLGNITDNSLAEINENKFFMWETATKNIATFNFNSADKTEDAVYAIGVDSSEPKIEILEESVQGVVKASFSRDKAMNLYTGLSKYSTQTQGYRYKFAVQCLQQVNATAKARISWIDSTGNQTKDISINVTEI